MSSDRELVDPEGRYPSDGLRRVEECAQRVLAHVPHGHVARTRDAIQIDCGDEEGIVILVTPEAIEFRMPTVEWTCGAYGPALASRLWKRVPTERLSEKRLEALIRQASEARRVEFHECKYCKKMFPPEHRHGDVCHGCAERHEGVVH